MNMANSNGPGLKMLLTYNILPEGQENYMRFVLNEFIPTLHSIGLANQGVWHTAWGAYPIRLLVFVSENAGAMTRAVESDAFEQMEEKLKGLVSEYHRRIVTFDPGFQF
jgi:hypothetical protein